MQSRRTTPVANEARERLHSESAPDPLAEQVFADPADIGAPGRRAVVLGCAGALFLVAGVDYWLGYEISFSVFYLFPIAGATWYGGRGTGLLFAAFGAAMWALSDWMSGHVYSHQAALYWNAGVRLAYFGVVAELLGRLQQLLARERHASETDALTGTFNRAGWFEAAEVELARARRNEEPIAVAYIDLDDFKHVNDSLGHAEGDRVLRHVASTLRESVRRSDVIARIGGDEFVVLLTNVDSETAKRLCDKLHETLTRTMYDHRWPVGFSIGIAAFPTAPKSVREIVIRADHCMYEAKRAGKNSVRLSS